MIALSITHTYTNTHTHTNTTRTTSTKNQIVRRTWNSIIFKPLIRCLKRQSHVFFVIYVEFRFEGAIGAISSIGPRTAHIHLPTTSRFAGEFSQMFEEYIISHCIRSKLIVSKYVNNINLVCHPSNDQDRRPHAHLFHKNVFNSKSINWIDLMEWIIPFFVLKLFLKGIRI